MNLINIGFSCYVSSERIVAVVEPLSSPIKRLIQEARDKGSLVDATYGKKTKSVIVTDSDHVILSARSPEYLIDPAKEDITDE